MQHIIGSLDVFEQCIKFDGIIFLVGFTKTETPIVEGESDLPH